MGCEIHQQVQSIRSQAVNFNCRRPVHLVHYAAFEFPLKIAHEYSLHAIWVLTSGFFDQPDHRETADDHRVSAGQWQNAIAKRKPESHDGCPGFQPEKYAPLVPAGMKSRNDVSQRVIFFPAFSRSMPLEKLVGTCIVRDLLLVGVELQRAAQPLCNAAQHEDLR